MENIPGIEIILALLGGAIVSAFANLLKKYFSKNNPQTLVIIAAIILGGLYQIFKVFIPVEMQKEIFVFVYEMLSSAVLIYEFVWKNYQPELKGSSKKNTKKVSKEEVEDDEVVMDTNIVSLED